MPFSRINPDDAAEIGVGNGDPVEVCTADGAARAMVHLEPTARRNGTFMLFGATAGTQGNAINGGVKELTPPNGKQSFTSWEVEL